MGDRLGIHGALFIFKHISFDGLPRERNTLYTKLKHFFLMAVLCLNDQATLLEYNTLKEPEDAKCLFWRN